MLSESPPHPFSHPLSAHELIVWYAPICWNHTQMTSPSRKRARYDTTGNDSPVILVMVAHDSLPGQGSRKSLHHVAFFGIQRQVYRLSRSGIRSVYFRSWLVFRSKVIQLEGHLRLTVALKASLNSPNLLWTQLDRVKPFSRFFRSGLVCLKPIVLSVGKHRNKTSHERFRSFGNNFFEMVLVYTSTKTSGANLCYLIRVPITVGRWNYMCSFSFNRIEVEVVKS